MKYILIFVVFMIIGNVIKSTNNVSNYNSTEKRKKEIVTIENETADNSNGLIRLKQLLNQIQTEYNSELLETGILKVAKNYSNTTTYTITIGSTLDGDLRTLKLQVSKEAFNSLQINQRLGVLEYTYSVTTYDGEDWHTKYFTEDNSLKIIGKDVRW